MDYEVVSGATRNFTPWRAAQLAEETEEEMLDRVAKEEAEKDVMEDLEKKMHDSKQEMAIADALDSIRSRNARIEQAGKEGIKTDIPDVVDDKRKLEEEEDAAAARRAFENAAFPDLGEEIIEDEDSAMDMGPPPPPVTFTKQPKPKKDPSAALGIKKKAPAPAPAPVPAKKPALDFGYGSDSD